MTYPASVFNLKVYFYSVLFVLSISSVTRQSHFSHKKGYFRPLFYILGMLASPLSGRKPGGVPRSAVEHYVDIVGVTSSNLVVPTISHKGFIDFGFFGFPSFTHMSHGRFIDGFNQKTFRKISGASSLKEFLSLVRHLNICK